MTEQLHWFCRRMQRRNVSAIFQYTARMAARRVDSVKVFGRMLIMRHWFCSRPVFVCLALRKLRIVNGMDALGCLRLALALEDQNRLMVFERLFIRTEKPNRSRLFPNQIIGKTQRVGVDDGSGERLCRKNHLNGVRAADAVDFLPPCDPINVCLVKVEGCRFVRRIGEQKVNAGFLQRFHLLQTISP